jgi:PAS domain-containing protein
MRFCRMTGFAKANWSASGPLPLLAARRVRPAAAQPRYRTGRQGAGQRFRDAHHAQERRAFDVRLYFSPLIDTNGQQIGWMASMNDITEPKRVRVELERAHERFVTVIDGLDSAACGRCANGEILFANRAFQSIYGFDAVGRDRPRSPPPAARPRTPTARPRHRQRRTALRALRRRDPARPVRPLVSPAERAIRWVDGRTVRVQIAADITDRKHIDEVNLQQQKRLEQTSRLITMGEMASSLAHELNQPLSAIANYCAGCVKRMQAGNQARRPAAAMQKASSRPSAPARSSAACATWSRKATPTGSPSPSELIDEARAFADIDAQRTGTQIIVDLPEHRKSWSTAS